VTPAAPAPEPDSRQALARLIDSLVALPAYRNAHWGILIVDAARSDTLYSLNAGKLFIPGSNMKIVTGAVALATLGPDYRFRTSFAARGRIRANGTLAGDLLVIGGGDPSLGKRLYGTDLAPFLAMADSLRARGIRRIAGRLLAAGDAFADAPHGFGWSWDDLAEGYGAGVDELMVAEGAVEVAVLGGRRLGDPAVVAVNPELGYPRVISRVRTAPRDTAPRDTAPTANGAAPSLVVRRDSAAGVVLLDGEIGIDEARTLDVAFPDQRAAFLAALTRALRDRGVSVGGASSRDTTATADTLFTFHSPPLRELVPAMEKPSLNQMAEAIFKALALEREGTGTAAAARRLVDTTLLQWGASPDGFVVRDGSGLSRYNYISPETLVRVLDRMRRDSLFELFRTSLPAAGREGTLTNRLRGTPAEGIVNAKTGFVTGARSLSGYAPAADGRILIFSLLCNNWTVPMRDVESVQDAIVTRLVTLQLGDSP
jgi:D-alanyl-D-alanine carboxypeptidase/D-alanyl-D-alanine-endopeptidase (penicillin-binding protein 4)